MNKGKATSQNTDLSNIEANRFNRNFANDKGLNNNSEMMADSFASIHSGVRNNKYDLSANDSLGRNAHGYNYNNYGLGSRDRSNRDSCTNCGDKEQVERNSNITDDDFKIEVVNDSHTDIDDKMILEEPGMEDSQPVVREISTLNNNFDSQEGNPNLEPFLEETSNKFNSQGNMKDGLIMEDHVHKDRQEGCIGANKDNSVLEEISFNEVNPPIKNDDDRSGRNQDRGNFQKKLDQNNQARKVDTNPVFDQEFLEDNINHVSKKPQRSIDNNAIPSNNNDQELTNPSFGLCDNMIIDPPEEVSRNHGIETNNDLTMEITEAISKHPKLQEISNKLDNFTQIWVDSVQDIKKEVLSAKYSDEMPNKIGKSTHKELEPSAQHLNTFCNGCNAGDITGKRFKCLACWNYDLCENCEETIEHPHPMIRILAPESTPHFTELNQLHILRQRTDNQNENGIKERYLRHITKNAYADSLYKHLLNNKKHLTAEEFIIEISNIFN